MHSASSEAEVAPVAPVDHTPSSWPVSGTDGQVIFLLDAANGLERKLLRKWIEQVRPAEFRREQIEILEIPCARRRHGRVDPRLESLLAAGSDPTLSPLRIAWFPAERDGRRSARLSDLLTLGDPRDPGALRAQWLRYRHPDRCRVVVGEPALASELRERWRVAAGSDSGATVGLAEFIARQAGLALERAERRLRGARYKVPRFVHDEVLSRPALRGELSLLGRELGIDEVEVQRKASKFLSEIAATHSTFVIDLVVQLWIRLFTRGYDQALQYEASEIDSIRALSQKFPVVFLPTHKSNLDHPVLQLVLHENGLPPNHTAGGINMNFFPIGPLVRRSGTFFIRRTFKGLPIYKAVLGHYIDYLIEKRFPLEWYIEGGRSRSGKLMPPRFGMLAYVVDAYRRGCSDDVYLVPVSICYDQISDVGDYAAEQRGGAKQAEGFAWFLGIVRRLGRSYGKIFIRFGEPVSLLESLGDSGRNSAAGESQFEPNEQSLAVQKLAFEVCVRINRVTPITPISLVCLAMLGRGNRALTADEMVLALANLVQYVERRGLHTTEPLQLKDAVGVRVVLENLTSSGLLVCFDEGPDEVYRIADDQHLAAAYYRNTVIHYFVNGAIIELALLASAEEGVEDRRATFWDEAMRLRDLLKFEFFFSEKDLFREELRAELTLHDSDVMRWSTSFDQGPGAILDFLQQVRPYSAHRTLRPFLEAYRVVADALQHESSERPFDKSAFLAECLARGTQYSLQQHVKRQESVSNVLFATALKLAGNRGLVRTKEEEEADSLPPLSTEERAQELDGLRHDFASEVHRAIRRVDAVESFVRARNAGL